MERGSKGEAVRRLQEALQERGFDIVADGIYGAGTEAAVEEFQQQNSLTPDRTFDSEQSGPGDRWGPFVRSARLGKGAWAGYGGTYWMGPGALKGGWSAGEVR